jgi:hypothetical protein
MNLVKFLIKVVIRTRTYYFFDKCLVEANFEISYSHTTNILSIPPFLYSGLYGLKYCEHNTIVIC